MGVIPGTEEAQSLSLEQRWNSERVKECVDLWQLNDHHTSELLEFKDRIQDIDHWKNDPFEVIRFLREFKYNLHVTEQKFRHSIQWRLEVGADRILEDYQPPRLYNYFPAGVLEGADHDGDPIYIERSGAADMLGLLHRFGKDEMVHEAIWVRELMTRGPWHQNRPKRVKYFTAILDLKGLNRHHLNPSLVQAGQVVTRLIQDNYPGIGKKILVIRSPALFRFVWNIFKHFVDPHVKELLEMATEKETDALLAKYMDLTVLPKEVCPAKGKGRAEQGFNPVWEGGPIPSPSDKDQEKMDPVFASYKSNPAEEEEEEAVEAKRQGSSRRNGGTAAASKPIMQHQETHPTTTTPSPTSSQSTSWEQLPLPNANENGENTNDTGKETTGDGPTDNKRRIPPFTETLLSPLNPTEVLTKNKETGSNNQKNTANYNLCSPWSIYITEDNLSPRNNNNNNNNNLSDRSAASAASEPPLVPPAKPFGNDMRHDTSSSWETLPPAPLHPSSVEVVLKGFWEQPPSHGERNNSNTSTGVDATCGSFNTSCVIS